MFIVEMNFITWECHSNNAITQAATDLKEDGFCKYAYIIAADGYMKLRSG